MNLYKKLLLGLFFVLFPIFSAQSIPFAGKFWPSKLAALAVGLGTSYHGYQEYKQWNAPQPSAAVQNWVKNTLKSQGVADKELSGIKIIGLTDELRNAGVLGFAAIKDTIYVSISHRELRKVQIERTCWLINQYIKKIFNQNPILQLRRYALSNPLEQWQTILAHEWNHIEAHDYDSINPQGQLEKEREKLHRAIDSLPEIEKSRLEKLVDSLTPSEFRDELSKTPEIKIIYQKMDEARQNLEIFQNFYQEALQICTNRIITKSSEFCRPSTAEDLAKIPDTILAIKEIENKADNKAIGIYKNNPEKLWAAANFFAKLHNDQMKNYKLNNRVINLFDSLSINKYKPYLIEYYISYAHPPLSIRAIKFAKAAREAEIRKFGRTE